MITVYPHETDWDRIAQLTGDNSWSSERMRKYFQEVERCHYCSKTLDFVTGGRHGFQGWLSVERPNREALEKVIKNDPQLERILTAVALTTLEDLPGSTLDAIVHRAIPKLFSAALKEDINHMDSIKYRPGRFVHHTTGYQWWQARRRARSHSRSAKELPSSVGRQNQCPGHQNTVGKVHHL